MIPPGYAARTRRQILTACGAFLLIVRLPASGPASDRLIVACDQGVSYATGRMTLLDAPEAGGLLLLDFNDGTARSREIPAVPASVIGPPTSVALHPRAPLALVTCAMVPRRVDGGMQHIPDNRVSLVRLEGPEPGVIATLEVGRQPSSVGFLPHGRAALVTNRSDGTISVLAVEAEGLSETARVKVAEPADSLAHIEISPDGTQALATLNKSGDVLLLGLDDDGRPHVLDRARDGRGPYAARFLPDGRGACVAHIESNEVVFYAVASGRLRKTGAVSVGRVPEGIDVSPDGEWIAVSCMEGFGLEDRNHPSYGQPGRVHLLRRSGSGYSVAGALEIGGGPQAVAFSSDGRQLFVARTGFGSVVCYRREGDGFVATEARWTVPGEPVAMRGR